jgi:hypothetical protein
MMTKKLDINPEIKVFICEILGPLLAERVLQELKEKQ